MKLTPYHSEKLQQLAAKLLGAVNDDRTPTPAAVAAVVVDALPLFSELQMLAEHQRRDELIASIAAELLPWEAAGDEAAAQRAVTAARQLMNAAESYTGGVSS
jgi:predicted nuclease with RNAse H fold